MVKLLLVLIFSTILYAKDSLVLNISSKEIANAKSIMIEGSGEELKYVAFSGKRFPFYKKPYGDGYYALLSTSYYQKPKHTKATVVYMKDGVKKYRSFAIDIVKGNYKKEKLSVNPSKAKFSTKDKVRITKEAKEAKKIYKTYTPTLYVDEPFSYPLHSKITSSFGNSRIFNGILKSYHSGTDFRAKTRTPIKATNSGVVVIAKNRFFAGNSVVIDHGHGIYTGYYHLSKFKVKVGDFVHKEDVVGLSGATGRVTGPHLHFSVHVGGNCVDPLQFLELVNGRLF